MRGLWRFIRDTRGLTAVEFGFVGPPFLLTLVSIVELGLLMTTQAQLDGATRDAARLIRTGQVFAAGNNFSTFQNRLCTDMSILMSTTSCQSNVVVNVVNNTNADFTQISFGACNANFGTPPGGGVTPCPFNAGNAGDAVGVRVIYNRSFIAPWVGAAMKMASAPIVSTVVFRNEPF